MAAAVAGWLAYFLIGPTLVERILPPSYAAAVEPLSVLVPSVAVIGVYSILSGWLLGIGRPWTAALCLATGATVTIIGHTLLTSEYGAVGAGVAMGIGATTALLLASLASWRILRSGNPPSVAGASR